MDLSGGIINTPQSFGAAGADPTSSSGVDIHDLEVTPTKIAAARSYGYSDADIVSYLSQNSALPVTDARKAGYSDSQIVDYLAKPPAPEPTPDVPSAASTALHAGERGVLPAAGGWAGMAAGAKLGAIAGAAIPGLGETGIGEAGGAIVGGLVGGFAGSAAVDKAQQMLMDLMPDDVLAKIGQSTSQQQAEELAHPYVAMAAELAPNLFLLRPGFGGHAVSEGAGTLERALASPIGSRAVGAGLMGAQEAASEEVENGDVDPAKVAIAAGAGALMNKETGLGRVVRGAGEGIVPNIGPYRDSAVATADDVMSAPDIDAAIEAADTASSTAVPDTTDIAAGAKMLDDHVADQQQEKLNSLFKGLNSGTVEQTSDDSYVYKTTDDNGQEVAAPIKVWNPDVDQPALGEDAISPELAKVQTDHYGQMGIDVVYFQNDPSVPFDGAVDPKQPNTIFLSNDPSRNAAQVGAHEVTHVLESTPLPDGTSLGDLLHQQVAAGLTAEGRDYAQTMFGSTAPARDAFPAGPEGDAAHNDAVTLHLVKELGADIGGEAPKFDTFIPKVIDAVQARYGASVAQDVLAKFLAGIKSAMETLRKFFGADQNNTESQNWVSNLSEVHDTLAKMQAERYGSALERQQAADAGATDLAARQQFLKTGELPEKAPAEPVTGETGLPVPAEPSAAAPAGAEAGEAVSVPPAEAHASEAPEAPAVTGEPHPMQEVAAAAGVARDQLVILRRWLGDMAAEHAQKAAASPMAKLLRQTAAAIMLKAPEGGELPPRAAARLAEVKGQLRALERPAEDTPEMSKVRAALDDVRQQVGATRGGGEIFSPRVTKEMADRLAVRRAAREAQQEPATVEREPVLAPEPPAASPAPETTPEVPATEPASAEPAQRRLTMPTPEGKGGKIVRAANSEETQALVNADQQKRVSKAFDRDFDRSVEIAMRERQPPEGILPSFYFLEAERRATRDGNLDLIMKLRQSPVAEELTTAARTVQSFATRDPQSAVARISDVEAARRAAAESAAMAQHGSLANAEAAAATKASKEIRTAVKAQMRARKPDAWQSFIASITCGVK